MYNQIFIVYHENLEDYIVNYAKSISKITKVIDENKVDIKVSYNNLAYMKGGFILKTDKAIDSLATFRQK